MSQSTPIQFSDLGLAEPVLRALEKAGYTTPTPIQERTIPVLLEGKDLLGQAQTGTGKTAAFTLPLLCRMATKGRGPSVLVLTPTRELAIQVAQAMQTYGQFMKGLRIVPIYGGTSFVPQLHDLKAGTDIVVGTPGRVMDHIRRGTLCLDGIQAFVLDEADEMLKMGFVDDVEWILERAPSTRQIALFSATMPQEIRRIAGKYLNDATHIVIEKATTTADTIRQHYVVCAHRQKVDHLAHLLEAENTEGVLIFVRTREATMEVSSALNSRGYDSAALSGDVAQRQRESIVNQLREGKRNIIVATDVAARGLDVSRISHVINFDMPDEPETYVHRVGRTGRAGRTGEAITFVTPKENHRLRRLENATRRKLMAYVFPTPKELRTQRIEKLNQKITEALGAKGIDELESVVKDYVGQHDVSAQRVAAALIGVLRGGEPLEGAALSRPKLSKDNDDPKRRVALPNKKNRQQSNDRPARGMDRYRMDIGRSHGIVSRQILGVIQGETGLQGQDLGHVEIHNDYSTIDLPLGMPRQILRSLKRTRVADRQLRLTKTGH